MSIYHVAYRALKKKPLQSAAEMDWKAIFAARSSCSSVRGEWPRRICLILLHMGSMGLKSGEYGGRYSSRAPAASRASRTPRILCVARLSRITTSPGRRAGASPCVTQAKTFRRSWGLQKAKERRDPPDECRRSRCSSDSVRAGCAPRVFAHPARGPAGASSWCWLRFRPQTPDGP